MLGNAERSSANGFLVECVEKWRASADTSEWSIEPAGGCVPLGKVGGIGFTVEFESGFFNPMWVVTAYLGIYKFVVTLPYWISFRF